MDRKAEQADLILRIGHIFGPMLRVGENPSVIDLAEQYRVIARFCSDIESFGNAVGKFAYAEPNHSYGQVHAKVLNILGPMRNYETSEFQSRGLIDRLNHAQRKMLEIIASIPIPDSQEIFDAQSPFAAHCHFRNLCSTVAKELQWQDRYFDQSVFDRYLALVPKRAQITLVTWPESKCRGARDEARYKSFMDISKLFAIERGTAGYRLITVETFHDRWLRCDSNLYTHGDSIKALGEEKTFTISKLSSTPDNRTHFDEPLSTGTEVFGPAQPIHP